MSDHDLWLAANDRALKAEMAALRERLQGLVPRFAQTASPRPAGWRAVLARFGMASNRMPPADEASTPAPVAIALAPHDANAEDSALTLLCQRLGLNEFERQTLLLCSAMEFDTGFGALCAQAQREPSYAWPSFGLALSALDNPAWDAMSPERPLRYWRLIEINQPGSQPLIAARLKADERIVNYIKGLNYLDDRLTSLVEAMPRISTAPLPPSHMAITDLIDAQLERSQIDGVQPPLFQMLGDADASKLAIAQALALRHGLMLYRLPASAVPNTTGDAETFLRLWQRETALLPVALYVQVADLEGDEGAQNKAALRLLERSTGGLIFLSTRTPRTLVGRASLSLEVARPLPSEQRALWLAAIGESGAAQAAHLTGQFNLDQAAITAIAARASTAPAEERDATLWHVALDHSRPALDQLAQPINPRVGWADIELAPRERTQLQLIAAQVRNRSAVYDDMGFRDRLSRGLGISVLFAGDSGTGKTMAAEALARELGLLLYRIDLSGVVSKYIGETEKNLRKLFDAAENGGAILFFDEADALFGKRSEVKDSHDRFANIEINYLLQRMESYRGLAILTTNMKSSLDPAFVRRLRFIVNFPFPGAAERAGIWRKVFPPGVDTSGLDFARLARLNLTGGSIHNIALGAAFAAAESKGGLTMPILLETARAEFIKLEKPVNEADFRWLATVGGTA
jgi:ATPase family associated with various cellular activities (AAA)